MIYRILRRIFRQNAPFHLFIPLIVGVGVEVLYVFLVDTPEWQHLSAHLLSGPRIALYAGIFLAYLVVTAIIIQRETEIGVRQLDLNVLADSLHTTDSLFAIGTMNFDEWFDPVVQVYLATIYQRKRKAELDEGIRFQYERVLLLTNRSAKKNLSSDYLDGYHAKCLIGIHNPLDIGLYFIEWHDIVEILNKLSPEERISLGYYPKCFRYCPNFLAKLLRPLMFILGRRRRVRKMAVGVLSNGGKALSAFRFSKRDKVLSVRPEPSLDACVRFVELIKGKIFETGTQSVQVQYDFTKYFIPT